MGNHLSTVSRKGAAFLKQIPRTVRFIGSHPSDYQKRPPVIVNSFPKSGTHLLSQVVEALPGLSSFGSFLASMPSIPYRVRSRRNHLWAIRRFVPGEVILAHLFYDREYDLALAGKNCVHYFIYRDLRDVAISEAYYLTFMNRWHRMHKCFSSLEGGMEASISLAIRGLEPGETSIEYPNIGERFQKYEGWLNSTNALAIRYEDLMSEHQQDFLLRIARHYLANVEGVFDVEGIVEAMGHNIKPERSHTFRQGSPGAWEDEFSGKHRRMMKDVAGQLLIDLGYEKNLDW